MEIAIVTTEHIGVSALGGLHHIKIVGITERGEIRLIEKNGLTHLLQELGVVVNFFLGQRG